MATGAASAPPAVPLSERGPAPTRIVVTYGFWLFLLSDIVMFAAFFASYAVLRDHTAGGPSGAEVFHRNKVLIETACLLFSSYACALLALAVERHNRLASFAAGAATLALGIAFIVLEATEFAGMVDNAAGPSRSAFLSAFFALVGLHGLHVCVGAFWLLVMLVQIATLGFPPAVLRRIRCFSLFWHSLDIVWIGVFTIVYLGAFT
ncbi:cytochrome c oxidase subunit 3 [Pigmentiphaga litoralis]|uniref:cytochrome c oxidase subunit 3 n=1 Tax=Pigmentiphaga litoralis TaxID=516702 RepID=UPI003B4349DB